MSDHKRKIKAARDRAARFAAAVHDLARGCALGRSVRDKALTEHADVIQEAREYVESEGGSK